MEDAAIAEVCKNSTVEIPSGMIETQIDNMEQDISQRLSYQGMNLDQYLQMVGKTKQEFATYSQTLFNFFSTKSLNKGIDKIKPDVTKNDN